MTKYAELIAEAEQVAEDMRGDLCANSSHQSLFARLAAAVREPAPPEGWRVGEFVRADFATATQAGPDWGAFLPSGQLLGLFPTASAAMAALDGEKP